MLAKNMCLLPLLSDLSDDCEGTLVGLCNSCLVLAAPSAPTVAADKDDGAHLGGAERVADVRSDD